ncbi:MAG: LytR C-terminal domain-containing protein [Mycobacterium sp.]|uniref:LytR C-terminal domain-containing protein n=1 Tax=Mycobacterium sp. TaxID=1785 RepID=UPI001ED34338|nr:LytR C-terminal domain-containing protein [Mycobacterium sp.]MBW0017491.1 LytR C-terminal domain-containing protein [Mycobacterium sp.]
MNERVPDSSGLPLRAMVMVLLFLGVIFLLLGWQAVGSSGNSDDDSSPVSSAATSSAASPSTSGKPAATQAEVRVYNISGKEGVARRAVDQLKAAGFNVGEPDNLTPPPSDVTVTTVYYSDAEGEKATADAVGQKLGAPVERRIPALADQPPGVIVLVTG